MKRAVGAGILAVTAVVAVGFYLLRVSPVANAPLGLHQFDEAKARERVLKTSEKLLDNPGPVYLRFAASTDRETLENLQRLAGLTAASHWATTKLPIQRWSYRVFPVLSLDKLKVLGEQGSLMSLEVSGTGQVMALEIGSPKQRASVPRTKEEAKADAEDLLRFLGVDVGSLALTAYTAGENSGKQRYDFTWRAPVQGLPGVSTEYSAVLEGGYIKAFSRKTVFDTRLPSSAGKELVLPLLALAAWFFLGLLFFFLLLQKLRRDEVDLTHFRRVFLLSGGVAFFAQLFRFGGRWLETLLGAALVAVLFAILFGLLWSVSESLLRQAYPDKLKLSDLVIHNTWRVKELGTAVLWCAGAGLSLLALPAILYLTAAPKTGGSLVLLPWVGQLEGLPIPGGLLVEVLVGPLPWVVLLGTVFLGILYPFLRLRFKPWLAVLLFAVAFGGAVSAAVPVGPALLAFTVATATGLLLFTAMERGGLLSGMMTLYLPLAVLQAAPLLLAKQTSVMFQGLVGLGLLAICLLLAAWLSCRGKLAEEVQDYEPVYLSRIRERERFARELEIAKSLQERFLPKQTPAIPGFSLAGLCTPAMEVGGDYFDFLPLPESRWLIVLGDVSGKGVKAAFYMTLTKGILHAVVGLEKDETAILCHLNRLFGQMREDGAFLTLCAVMLDPAKKRVHILSAGHNPPVLVHKGEASFLSPRGLVLGIMPNEVFVKTLENCTVALEPGDTLVLYTDGVTEAMNRKNDEFGPDRLLATVQGGAGQPAEQVLAGVSQAVRTFVAGAPQADDLTLLVVKVNES